VDDGKVSDKKFAFTCPKCSTENIIDNRKEMDVTAGGSVPQGSDSAATTMPSTDGSQIADSGNIPDIPQSTMESTPDDSMTSTDLSTDETLSQPIDATDDSEFSIDFDETLMTEEETKNLLSEESDDLTLDLDADIDLDLSMDEEGQETEVKKEDNIDDDNLSMDLDVDLGDIDSIDDIGGEELKNKTSDMPDTEVNDTWDEPGADHETEDLNLDLDVDLDDLDQDDSSKDASEDLSVTNSDLDIGDFTSADEPVSKDSSDVDNLDLSFDENDVAVETEFDGDSLDLDFEEAIFEEAEKTTGDTDSIPDITEADASINAALSDDALVLDEFKPVEEDLLYDKNDSSIEIKDELGEDNTEIDLLKEEDESITIDLDSLDIEFEEDDSDNKEGELPVEDDFPDIDSSVDMNASKEPAKEGDLFDEDITLDLDSLDIPLAEEEEIKEGEVPDDSDLISLDLDDKKTNDNNENKGLRKDDDDITLDLDSLDIPLAEEEEIKEGEVPDEFDEEEEKLTLEDAGLTFDELSKEEKINSIDDHMFEDDEEDIKLTIDEIDPSLNVDNLEQELTSGSSNEMEPIGDTSSTDEKDMDNLHKELSEAEDILMKDDDSLGIDFNDDLPDIDLNETDNDLPDINLDDYDDLPDINLDDDLTTGTGVGTSTSDYHLDDDLDNNLSHFDDDYYSSSVDKKISEMKVRGASNLSIDYSLRYSRLGGALRLFGIFFLGMIPHLIVSFVYSILSFVLGFLNHIIVISTGNAVEDFQNIQENTIRHLISISASTTGIVEEWPIFAGKEDIDHPLQINVTYTLKNSRLLAFLRLSGIGIMVMLLPHLVLLFLMTIALPIVFVLPGLIMVIITARYPHFIFDFIVKYFRYLSRIMAFASGVIDEYPHFKFD